MASRVPSFVKRDVIGKKLQSQIADLSRGKKVIRGSLSIAPGHDYWWFLEYGTGPFREPPKGDLSKPASVEGERAVGHPYTIEVDHAKFLVYLTHGRRMRRLETIHPGIKPIGFVRTALFEAEIFLKEDLDRLTKRHSKGWSFPKRDELVRLVNYILEVLLGELRLLSPDDSDPDPYHEHRPHTPPLSEAWRVTKAK